MSLADQSDYDLVLIGGGIMSATLGVLLKLSNPNLRMLVVERLAKVALESSNAWNNAGTGHAALCELNYMPDDPKGGLPSPAKAIAINQQFQESREFWANLVQRDIISRPDSFIRSVPHMTFVRGEKDVDYLSRRFLALKDQPLFAGLEYTDEAARIASWAPLLMQGRASEPVAATRIEQGTDVDYGELTRQLFEWLEQNGVEIRTNFEAKRLRRVGSYWEIHGKLGRAKQTLRAPKVFVGAGGWALKLLQSSSIAEVSGYGTFPVSGHFLKTESAVLVDQHFAKVYSQAQVGAPPMSVPHLDARIIDGRKSLLFGPFAGLNFKFLKHGSWLDLAGSVRPANLWPYLSVALGNLSLVWYLIREILKTPKQKLRSLREFVPLAQAGDWQLYEAGQRAQIIKPSKGGGVLQFGTEVIASSDGSIAGLLGASPGASVAVHVMIEVLQKLFPDQKEELLASVGQLVPSYGSDLNANPAKAQQSLSFSATVLGLIA